MKKLTLTNYAQGTTLVLEKDFVDRYMPAANGEFVKVYLLILRHLSESTEPLSLSGTISKIADTLDTTEKDIMRALIYWKKQKLIDFDATDLDNPVSRTDSEAINETVTPVSEALAAPVANTIPFRVPEKKSEPVAAVNKNLSDKEFKDIVNIAENYLGKTLTKTEMEYLQYFYDDLHMSKELIDYLIEYCVDGGHKSFHYIKAVALNWKDENVTTVAKAKRRSVCTTKSCYSVLKAFGIRDRNPAPAELDFIRKWSSEYGFSQDLILEACKRTILKRSVPDFPYADGILRDWLSKQVHNRKDLESTDATYLKEKEKEKETESIKKERPKRSRFNNYPQRSYDFEELERELVR
ncbi:MAG: DnaD domain protein [Lachnospiraceae bacterium]|jgi:DnaD/phage-associated family protein|nr:DnaD domain protein [Lachnospiraceae bacterium]